MVHRSLLLLVQQTSHSTIQRILREQSKQRVLFLFGKVSLNVSLSIQEYCLLRRFNPFHLEYMVEALSYINFLMSIYLYYL